MHSSESALFILTCTCSLVFRVGGIEVVTDDEFQFARVTMVFLIEGAKAVADVDVLLRVEQVAAAEFHRQAVVEERLGHADVGHVSSTGERHVLLFAFGDDLQIGRGSEGR